ncbi:MAG: metal-dependent hydrolase [Thermoplasmatota archaeon]
MMPLGHLGLPLLPFLFKGEISWDVRLVVVGAVLPDLIDKPLGHLILPENNGRIIAHSIMFSAILLLSAVAWRPLMPVAYGTAVHQLLDGTFTEPQGALWPLMGGFRYTDYDVVRWLYAYTEPYVIAEEAAGAIVMISFMIIFGGFGWGNIRSLLARGRPEHASDN